MDALEAMHGGMPLGAEAGQAAAAGLAGGAPFPELLRQQLGATLLAAMVADESLAAADRACLTSASASLDSIRAGVRAVLRYFQGKGESRGVGVGGPAGPAHGGACLHSTACCAVQTHIRCARTA
jgi:hypothetical protein